MKLQVAFDITDLEKAIDIARQIEQYVDVLDIGNLLLFKHGEEAIRRFKSEFPYKPLLVDAKIADRGKDAVTLCIQSGADWITVLAGTDRKVIHTACSRAHEMGKKIMLDLVDASSLGQAALEAKSLGADALLIHKSMNEDDQMPFLDKWEMVKGNTTLPIYISAHTTRDNVAELLGLGAAGLVVGSVITEAKNPAEEAAFLASLM